MASVDTEHASGGDLVNQAVENSSLSIMITGPLQDDNPIVYVNRGFQKLTLYSREYALGRNCRFLQGEGTQGRDMERMREAIQAAEEVEVRVLNYRADGTAFLNQVLISPVVGEDGRVEAFFAVQREVAGEAAEEDEQARPAHSTPSGVMLRELQHRVKNHFSMIVSLIRMHARRDITEKSFDALSHRVEALALLYDELLQPDLAGEQEAEDIEGGAYLSRVAGVLAGISGRTTVRLQLNCDEVALNLDAAGRLGLLLTELLTNTFEHAFEGRQRGSVRVSLNQLEDGTVRLTVEDDGTGLPEGSNWPYDSKSVPEQREAAEREQGELDTTGKGGRSGLGGSIVRGLTEALGAELSVKSGPTGTTVTVEIAPGGVVV